MQNNTVWLQADELKKRAPAQRLQYAVMRMLADDSSSGFDKGVTLQRMLRYVSNFVGVKSPRISAGLNLANRCIDILALDTVIRTQLRITPQAKPAYDPVERRVQRYGHALCKLGLFDVDSIRYDMFSGDYDEGSFCAMGDAISALTNPVSSALQSAGIEIIRAEHLTAESDEADTYLFALKVCGSTFCLISSTYPKLLSFRADRDSIFFYSVGAAAGKPVTSRSFGAVLFTALDTFTRANFLAHLNPQKNFIEMASGQSLSIRARLPSVHHVYGLPADSIEQSIRYALDNSEKRVLAIVGNPGLGKTSAVHNIVNRFPDSPVFFVSPGAFSSSGNALAGIRALFKSVSSRKSRAIVVFDDFDGFPVESKNAFVTELLRQFSGNGEFNSVALLVINDPSKVHSTILRDERTDEIYLMGYIDDVKTLRVFFKDTFNVNISMKSKAAAFMLEHKFSTAALSSTVKYCQSRGSKIVDSSLLEAAHAIKQFQDIADLQCIRGKLTASAPNLPNTNGVAEDACADGIDSCFNGASPKLKHFSGSLGHSLNTQCSDGIEAVEAANPIPCAVTEPEACSDESSPYIRRG